MVGAKDYHLPDSASHTLSSGIALHPSVLFELLYTTFQLPLPLPIPLLSCALLRTLPFHLHQCCLALEGTAFERPLLLVKFCKALVFQGGRNLPRNSVHDTVQSSLIVRQFWWHLARRDDPQSQVLKSLFHRPHLDKSMVGLQKTENYQVSPSLFDSVVWRFIEVKANTDIFGMSPCLPNSSIAQFFKGLVNFF